MNNDEPVEEIPGAYIALMIVTYVVAVVPFLSKRQQWPIRTRNPRLSLLFVTFTTCLGCLTIVQSNSDTEAYRGVNCMGFSLGLSLIVSVIVATFVVRHMSLYIKFGFNDRII